MKRTKKRSSAPTTCCLVPARSQGHSQMLEVGPLWLPRKSFELPNLEDSTDSSLAPGPPSAVRQDPPLHVRHSVEKAYGNSPVEL